jgi:hypothetical protein
MTIQFEQRSGRFVMFTIAIMFLLVTNSMAQDPKNPRGDWQGVRDENTGVYTSTLALTVSPAAETRPAMKHRLMIDDYDRRDGNSALYYLKALGFFEQSNVRDRISQMQKQAAEKSRQEEKNVSEYPPYSYLDMHPDEYPRQEVQEYLRLLSFQEFFLKEAAQCKNFQMDRNIREFKSPISYLLPEIQVMRELARTQSVRTRLATAEGRVDDALRIVGQQLALGNHLGQDDFIVSNLVGVACSTISLTDLCFLLEHRQTPNLYWALATLPNPLVEMKNSLPIERHLLFLQVKPLMLVDETPKPAEYWRQELEQALPEIRELMSDFPKSSIPIEQMSWLSMYIAATYPSARDYLIRQHGMSEESLAKLCVTQTVLLGYRRCYEELRDEKFKQIALPFHQSHLLGDESQLGVEYGMVAAPANVVLPAITALRRAQARLQQLIGLLQTVEAIRQYGSENAGQLPADLTRLRLPAPLDPVTNTPLEYSQSAGKAVVSTHKNNNFSYRLIIQFRK